MKNRGKLIKKKKTIRGIFVRQILNVLRTGRYICPLIKIPVAVEFNKFELQIHASRIAFDFIGPVPAELFLHLTRDNRCTVRAVTSIADRKWIPIKVHRNGDVGRTQ